MFRLTVRDHVMIAHSLPDPCFGPAQGLHGATFVVEATFERHDVDDHGVVLDIGAAAQALAEVLAVINYRNLDDVEAFRDTLTTTEVVARYVADRLCDELDVSGLSAVEVLLREHPDAWASYRREL